MAQKVTKLCPVCLTESVGGLPHGWHRYGHRKLKRTIEEVSEAARNTIELNRVKAEVMDAVDRARYLDGWRSKPKSRAEYHREYYWRKVEARRATARATRKRARASKKLRPLILDLCHAVDLGRLTATW